MSRRMSRTPSTEFGIIHKNFVSRGNEKCASVTLLTKGGLNHRVQ